MMKISSEIQNIEQDRADTGRTPGGRDESRPYSMMKTSNDLQFIEQDRQTALELLHRRILTCRLCETHGYLAAARPLVHGRASDRIMVIGQAPGHRSVEKGRSFSGPGGRVLQKWLERAGFPPGYLHEHVYLSSLTRCDPGRNPRGNGDRRPSPPEVALCRPFLEAELAIVQPKVILLVGAMAIEIFVGKIKLEDVIGTFQEHDGILWLPLPHPSGVSRWLLDAAHQQLLQRALAILAEWRVAYHLEDWRAPARGHPAHPLHPRPYNDEEEIMFHLEDWRTGGRPLGATLPIRSTPALTMMRRKHGSKRLV